MTTKHIWFVRHGESLANVGGITSVASKVPLTERGKEQAKAAVKALTVRPTLIATSSYDRARETAVPAILRWPGVELTTWPVQEFTYLSWKKLGPTTVFEREQAAIPYWEKMDPEYIDGDDAESFNQMMQRIDETIDLIKSLKFESAIVFSHKLFLSVLFYRLVNQHPVPPTMEEVRAFLLEYNLPNAAIAHYTFDALGEAQMQRMMTDHLVGKAFSELHSGL